MIVDTTKTATEAEKPGKIHRRGYLIVCPKCGKSYVTFRDRRLRSLTCCCGQTISLSSSDTRTILCACRCGSWSHLRTNAATPEVSLTCKHCHRTNVLTWLPDFGRYGALPADTEDELIPLSLMVLHDKFGFGRDQATRFTAHLTSLMEECHSGAISLQDITDALEADGIAMEEKENG